ncbi:MAG: hypothetical protein KDB79_16745, partial [Acidobacteria bacterium]|nr:hypothetical protein [Acidobacteriota bacterium]
MTIRVNGCESPMEEGEEKVSADEGKPDLTREEKKQVKERSTPRAAVVYEAVREEGEFEMQRSISALAWSGLAA